jgi:hypothetical protein
MHDFDDEDDEKDAILQALSGEVDDFAGSQLQDPDKKGPAAGGVTITIAVEPHAQPGKGEGLEDEENEGGAGEEGDEKSDDAEHDEIAHILGMCGGGCPGEK